LDQGIQIAAAPAHGASSPRTYAAAAVPLLLLGWARPGLSVSGTLLVSLYKHTQVRSAAQATQARSEATTATTPTCTPTTCPLPCFAAALCNYYHKCTQAIPHHKAAHALPAPIQSISRWKSPATPSDQIWSPVISLRYAAVGQYLAPSLQQWCWVPVGSFVSHLPVKSDQSQENWLNGILTIWKSVPVRANSVDACTHCTGNKQGKTCRRMC
jgi:hypothetical protein